MSKITLTGRFKVTGQRTVFTVGGGTPPPVTISGWSSLYGYGSPAGSIYGYLEGSTTDSAGNVIAVGATDDVGNLLTVVKWDSTGTLLWQKAVGVADTYNALYGEIVVTDSSNNIYAVATNGDTGYVRVFKLTSGGSLSWQNEYNFGDSGNNVYGITNVKVVADGIILVCKMTGNTGLGLMKIDFTGAVVWVKGAYEDVSAQSVNATFTASGNIVITAGTPFYPGYTWYPRIFAAEYNSSFTLQNSNSIGRTGSMSFNYPSPAVATLGGYTYMSTDNDVIIKLDSSKNLVWARKIIPTTASVNGFNAMAAFGNYVYFLDANGYILIYNSSTDKFTGFYQLTTPDGGMYTWYYNTATGEISATATNIVVSGYTDNQGIVFNLPVNVDTYSGGLESVANGCQAVGLPFTIQSMFNYASYAYTPTISTITNYTVTPLSYPIASMTNTPSTGTFTALSAITPNVMFIQNSGGGNAPTTVNFTNQSSNVYVRYEWNFGDGNTSTQVSPSHTYTTASGTPYTVTLTGYTAGDAYNSSATSSVSVTMPAPVANFTGSPTSGVAPLTVNFTDTSSNSPTYWSWYQNGNYFSSSQNPSFQFTSAGDYSIELNAGNDFGNDFETKNNYISVIYGYLGTWNPNTNTPTLADGTGTEGTSYQVSANGTINLGSGPITVAIGGFVTYTGGVWVYHAPGTSSGSTSFQGTWDPATNTPTLVNGTGTPGYQYISFTTGTYNFGDGSITFSPGDYVTYNGIQWQRLPAYTGGFASPMQLTVNSGFNGGVFTLPIGNMNGTIVWGDGTYTNMTPSSPMQTHTYSLADTYTVSIYGTASNFGGYEGNRSPLTGVTTFGNIGLTSLSGAFINAPNLTSVPISIPSTVTDISYIFANHATFNSSAVTSWDTGNVTNMEYAFANTGAFNQPISSWGTSSVTNMSNMFANTTAFNQPIGSWNTSNVTNMSQMFMNAAVFDQSLNSWNTANVTNMSNMFRESGAFNNSIGSWNTSSVTNMSAMFMDCVFNSSINTWNVSSVTNMNSMFRLNTAFNQSLNSWTPSSVTDMSYMFQGATAFNGDIGNWTTSSVTNMNSMFNAAQAFNKNISSWNTGSVTNMSSMFSNATAFNQPIGSWTTSNVTNMSYMFNSATAFNQSLNSWNTSSVTNMANMFQYATAFNGDIGNWSTGSVTNMSYMFNSANAFNKDISSWNVSSVTNMSYMFNGATVFNQPIGGWNTAALTNIDGIFSSAMAFNQSLNGWNVSGITSLYNVFNNAQAFNGNISSWNVSNVTNMNGVFNNAIAFDQNISSWNVSGVTNMSYMFASADTFNQNISSWNVSSVTNMSNMFSSANLFNQNISGWNVSNVTNMDGMLTGAYSFNQNISGWSVSLIPTYPSNFATGTPIAPTMSGDPVPVPTAPNLPASWYPWGHNIKEL